jgi:hypothetical protein
MDDVVNTLRILSEFLSNKRPYPCQPGSDKENQGDHRLGLINQVKIAVRLTTGTIRVVIAKQDDY